MSIFPCSYSGTVYINTLRPRKDGRHIADDIFTCIFFNENCCILIKFSLKYVPKGPIDNNPALVHIMAWCRLGDKSLSEPMMLSLPTHICVTRPQWVKEMAKSKMGELLGWTGEFGHYFLLNLMSWRCLKFNHKTSHFSMTMNDYESLSLVMNQSQLDDFW